MSRIWLNHWFSTAYHFVNLLKEDGHTIIATNLRDTCVYAQNADEFYLEPEIEGEQYLDWALSFCQTHRIDIFFPKRQLGLITKQQTRFKDIGVKVVCESDILRYELLQNKFKTMQFLKSCDLHGFQIPEMEVVTTVFDFVIAEDKLSKKYGDICMKYNIDEGGQSYKRIKERRPSLSRLRENNGLVYSYDYVLSCLETVRQFPELIVMPYLNGEELSVDCLDTGLEFVANVRHKCSNRVTKISCVDKLIDACRELQKILRLEMPYNVQFRYHNDVLYLLEINTRLAGGAWKASYVGHRFPNLAIDKLNQCVKPVIRLRDEVVLSNIEEAVILLEKKLSPV